MKSPSPAVNPAAHYASIRPMTNSEWGLFFLLSGLFSMTFILAKLALADFRPLTIVLLRVSIAAVAMALIVRVSVIKAPRLTRRDYGKLFLMGLLNNAVPFSLIFWGQTQITSSLAAILNATMPVFTAILAHFLTQDERITPIKLLGIFLGFGGILVIFASPDTMRLGKFWGAVSCLMAPLSYAAASMVGRRLRHIPPVTAATGQLTAASLIMIPLVILIDRPWLGPIPSFQSVVEILILALACTAVPYWLYYRLLKSAGATNISLTTLVIPIGTILLGSLFLNETMTVRQIVGMSLVGLGLLTIDGRWIARLHQRIRLG